MFCFQFILTLFKHGSCFVSAAEDAKKAVRKGVDGILVSNHGGRQLDGVPATVNIVKPVPHESMLV